MLKNRKVEIFALIPARSGSKLIPDKNIRIIGGKPLLAHSVSHALASKLINRAIVSTDSPVYAEIARKYGAEVPFLRPSEFSQDSSTDLEVFTHALKWLAENEGYVPDICVHLRPTYPIRKIEDIDKVIQILIENPDIDSVRSVTLSKETPMKMWFRGDNGLLSPVVKTELNEPYNLPRQLLPQTYLQNACIDAVRTRVITEMKSMTGTKIFGYVMNENFDIDTEEQFQKLEEYLSQETTGKTGELDYENLSNERKTFCFDIDGVIATIVPGNRYDLAEPLLHNIHSINSLYEQGHQIILFTARGSVTGIDWTELTKKQLQQWGIKYHKLLFGKPAADYYIDDKMLPIEKVKHLIT
jgi:CMP-N-acetylneuraminic acid synthetase